VNRREHIVAMGKTLLLLGFSGIAPAHAAESKSDQANWENLKELAAGDVVRVELFGGQSYTAKFQSFSSVVMVVRGGIGAQTFAREDVLSVSANKESHRLRNGLIGAAVGCGAGLGIAAARSAIKRKEYPENLYFKVDGPILGVLLGGIGGSLAASLSEGDWRDVYRAR